MIVTIDGPAGAGKSSVARKLAERLGFAFLDTGAMYRAVTLACLRAKVALSDAHATYEVAKGLTIRVEGTHLWVDGEDVTSEIRRTVVTQSIRAIADNASIREVMVQLQRAFAAQRDVVTEGRDQGTVAFPHAECKIFLTATPEERARRRVRQLEELGATADYDEILSQQNQRDAEDESRSVGALRRADDAIEVLTDGCDEEQVLERLVEIVSARRVQNGDPTLADPAASDPPS